MSHTPGPWAVGHWSGQCNLSHAGTTHHHGPSHATDPCVYTKVLCHGYGGIAAVDGGMVAQSTYDGMEATAEDLRLMAAAPDLLAALQTAEMAMLGYTHRNEVIVKALKDARAAIAKASQP